jgi:hypothetical protein
MTMKIRQPTLETNSTRGTIDPGVVVRRSWFETTALEMPAGFGQMHHRASLARDGWPGPHLRTGDVTLVFTTDETCSNVKLLQREHDINGLLPAQKMVREPAIAAGGFEPPYDR